MTEVISFLATVGLFTMAFGVMAGRAWVGRNDWARHCRGWRGYFVDSAVIMTPAATLVFFAPMVWLSLSARFGLEWIGVILFAVMVPMLGYVVSEPYRAAGSRLDQCRSASVESAAA